jgi:hypothetical protein
MSMNMESKSISRRVSTAALFLTFAGVLFAETPGTNADSTASLELAALPATHSASNNSVTDATHVPTSLTAAPSQSTPSSRTMPGTPAGANASAIAAAANLNTIASVQEQSTKRSSYIGVQSGTMPLDIRMDPTSTQKYGAAPAMVQIRIGRN